MNLFKLTKFIPLILVLFALSMSSCKVQNVFVEEKYYEIDSTFFMKPELYEHIIRPGDKVSISVWDHDDLSVGSIYTIYNTNEVYGKWAAVAIDSTISVPKLGRVKLAGLSTREAEYYLAELFSKYIVDPIITLRVHNKEISVLGKVKSPGHFNLESDQLNIMDAIALSEGMVPYADKKRVRLVRQGKAYLVDLTRLDTYHLTNLNVRAGDILVIPSKNDAKFDRKINVIIPFASAISALSIAATFLYPALSGN